MVHDLVSLIAPMLEQKHVRILGVSPFDYSKYMFGDTVWAAISRFLFSTFLAQTLFHSARKALHTARTKLLEGTLVVLCMSSEIELPQSKTCNVILRRVTHKSHNRSSVVI